jgi:hypothetical protein
MIRTIVALLAVAGLVTAEEKPAAKSVLVSTRSSSR